MDLTDLLKQETIDIECPNCKTTILFKLGDAGTTITCSKCGSQITVQDDGFSKGLDKIDRKLSKLF